jgi:hypothetical protein
LALIGNGPGLMWCMSALVGGSGKLKSPGTTN